VVALPLIRLRRKVLKIAPKMKREKKKKEKE
jgi:hypothetical protein